MLRLPPDSSRPTAHPSFSASGDVYRRGRVVRRAGAVSSFPTKRSMNHCISAVAAFCSANRAGASKPSLRASGMQE